MRPSEGGFLQPQADRQELLLLKIPNQVLIYRFENPQAEFTASRKYFPKEAKTLCVQILRDFKHQLSLGDLAAGWGNPKEDA